MTLYILYVIGTLFKDLLDQVRIVESTPRSSTPSIGNTPTTTTDTTENSIEMFMIKLASTFDDAKSGLIHDYDDLIQPILNLDSSVRRSEPIIKTQSHDLYKRHTATLTNPNLLNLSNHTHTSGAKGVLAQRRMRLSLKVLSEL